MPHKDLPEADHVVRFIKPSLILWDETTGEAKGCFPQAFRLRDGEAYLSVSWLEFFPGSRTESLQRIREHAEHGIRARHGFGVLNVGQMHQAAQSVSEKIRIIHEPTDGNPSHSSVRRYPNNNEEFFALLANLAARNLVLSRDITAS